MGDEAGSVSFIKIIDDKQTKGTLADWLEVPFFVKVADRMSDHLDSI